MPVLTQGDLRIECAVPITDIQTFHMEISQNRPERRAGKPSCSRLREPGSWQATGSCLRAYCMPEKGERVYIHISGAAGGEDHAACGCIIQR